MACYLNWQPENIEDKQEVVDYKLFLLWTICKYCAQCSEWVHTGNKNLCLYVQSPIGLRGSEDHAKVEFGQAEWRSS